MAKDSVVTSITSTTEVDFKIPPNHGFNEGGDVIFRSLDGIDFSVHSVLLSLASPVFSGMVSIGTRTKKDVIAVGETSQMIALMLKFIYPVSPPELSSFEELDQALHVADKYQLDGMKTRLREKMAMTNSPVSIASNPLRALAITIPHGLKEETETAMHSASKYYNFSTGGALVRLANAVPSTLPCIQLIGPLSVRTRVLAEVLFAFHRAPMQLTGDACREFLCKPCETMYFSSGLHSAPEWQARWAYEVFTELQGRPVQEWDPFFELEFFHTAMHRGGDVPILLSRSGNDRKYECECPDLINQYSDDFEVWAWGVLDALTARLKSERLDSYGRLRLDSL